MAPANVDAPLHLERTHDPRGRAPLDVGAFFRTWGQNVNKVASKVELRFDFEHSAVLHDDTRARLRVIAQGRLDSEGRILVVSQVTRDRQRNLDDARAKLAEMITRACHRPKRRRPTRPSRGAKESRLNEKRHHSARKRDRSSAGFE